MIFRASIYATIPVFFRLLMLFLIVVSFLYAFFINAKVAANVAFGITAVVFTIFMTLFAGTYSYIFIAMSVSTIAIMRCGKKFTPIWAWVAVVILIALSYVISEVEYRIVDSLFKSLGYVGVGEKNYNNIILNCISLLPGIGFMIAATIIRKRRIDKGILIINPEKRQVSIAVGSALSCVSFICFLYGFSYLLAAQSWPYGNDFYNIAIVLAVVSVVLGFVGWILLHLSKKSDKLRAFYYMLYVWGWICLVITVAIGAIIVICLSVMSSMGEPSYMKSGKRVVTDEKGKKHKLDYKGGEKEEVADESGTVWVTDDGGMTFRKRDTYIYVDEDMKKHYLQDKIGGAQFAQGRGSSLEENKGVGYDVGLWGDVTKQKLWDDEHEGILGTIQQSDAIKADLSDE